MSTGQWIGVGVFLAALGGLLFLMFRNMPKHKGDGGPGDGPSVGTGNDY